MGMWCYSSLEMGMLGSAYVLGMGFAGVINKVLSDTIGRKWSTVIMQVCITTFHAMIVFVSNQWSRYVFLFLMGCMGIYTNYMLVMESCPERLGGTLMGMIMLLDSFKNGMFGTFYFWFISKNWFWLFAGHLAVTGIPLLIALLFIQESP